MWDQKWWSPEYVPTSPRSTRLNRRALVGQSRWKQPTLLSIYSYIKQVQYFLPLPTSVGCLLCSTKGPDTLNWRLWWIAFEVRSLYRCRGFIPAQSSSRLWIDSWKSCEDQSLIRCGVVPPLWERRGWWRPVQVTGVLMQLLFQRSPGSNCFSSLGINSTYDFTKCPEVDDVCSHLASSSSKADLNWKVHCKATCMISVAWI